MKKNYSPTRVILTLIFAALAYWAGNTASHQIRTDVASGANVNTVIGQSLDGFTNSPLSLSFHQTDILAGLIAVAIVGLIWAYNTVGIGTRRDGEEHGSATWANPRDIRPFINRDYRSNLLFTKTEQLNLDSHKTHRNLNTLVIGGSGSGKSRYFVGPNLAQCNTSFVITDPKGELLASHGHRLAQAGYQLRTFNLVDFANSDTFNPFYYFNPDQAEVSCAILVENFMANTSGTESARSASGDFFVKAERALLTALVAYVYFTRGRSGTLIDVVDLLARMQAFEKDDDAKSEIDQLFNKVEALITQYDTDTERNKWGSEAVATLQGLRFAASQYRTYTQGAGETKKSVIISLGVRMAPLHMAPIRNLLSSDTMRLDEVGDTPTALFIITPDTHAAFTFLVSMFYEQLFETNLYKADHLPGGRLPIQVQCFMDEFANIGKMPSFERKIAVMRSRGISTAIIIQNFAQGKALYRDDWETIVGNCDSLLFLGGNEKTTTEYVSKMLGQQTISATDTSESRGRSGSWTTQHRTLARDLLSPDEIGRIPTEKCIYFLRGLPAFYSTKLGPAPEVETYIYDPEAEIDAILGAEPFEYYPNTNSQ